MIRNLQQDLQSPVVSFRLQALETAVREARSPDVLAVLEARQAVETHEECRQLLAQAIELCRSRIAPHEAPAAPAAPVPLPSDEGSVFRDRFLQASTAQRLESLLRLREVDRVRLAARAPILFEKEAQPAVAILILRTFGLHWPREYLDDLFPHLSSQWLSLRLAALEVLIQRDPEKLREALPRLLVSDDPRTQALAIRGLARIDLEEAIEHLRCLLEDPDPTLRRVALQNCYYLPFDRLRPLLYQFLGREALPELVADAGLLFAINPCPEVPFRLWELIDQAPSDRRPFLQPILERSIQALEKSRSLKVEAVFFRQRLELWGRRRRLEILLQQWLTQASHEDETIGDLEVTLRAHAADPDSRQVFEQALGRPISQALRDRIKSWFPKSAPPPDDPAAFRILSETDQIRLLTGGFQDSQDEQTRNALTALLAQVLSDTRSPPRVRAAALRRAMGAGDRGYVDLAHQWLNQQFPQMISAALEYIGRFDVDKVPVILGRFLKHSEPRIRAVCICLLRDLDPDQAISLLRSLLRSSDRRQQAMAMSWMVYFDFSRIRALLTEFLEGCTDSDLFRSGMCLFLTNPDPEHLFILFRLDQKADAGRRTLIESFRKQMTAELISQGTITIPKLATLQQGFAKRLQEENRQAAAPIKPWAAARLRPTVSRQSFPASRSGMPEWTERPLFRLGFALLLGSLLYGASWLPNLLESSSVPVDSDGGKAGAVSTVPRTITGTVIAVSGTTSGLTLQTEGGERYLVIPKVGETLAGTPGERRKLVVIPFRRNSRGIILCQEP